jgi:hypothetical protein
MDRFLWWVKGKGGITVIDGFVYKKINIQRNGIHGNNGSHYKRRKGGHVVLWGALLFTSNI